MPIMALHTQSCNCSPQFGGFAFMYHTKRVRVRQGQTVNITFMVGGEHRSTGSQQLQAVAHARSLCTRLSHALRMP
jgi:hypothetical protein